MRTRGRRKGLLIADMDSTIIAGETLDELAGFAGLKTKSPPSRGVHGRGTRFAQALRLRVSMLKG